MHRIILMVAIGVSGFSVYAQNLEKMVVVNFRNSPITQVLELYANLTKSTVVVERATYPAVTLVTETRMRVPDLITLMENHLKSNGVLIHKSDNIYVSMSPNARFVNGGTYMKVDRIELSPEPSPVDDARATQRSESAKSVTPHYSKEELERLLEEYRKQVVESGLPPLPEEKSSGE